MTITEFIRRHYRHFNAATLVDAADAYAAHVEAGGKMLITLGGAMSTAELGRSLAEMIRQDKVHAISCTGANLEEDLFNLVAHDHYKRIPDYRNLTPQMEKDLEHQGLNRVTDTCIPEAEAFRAIEKSILELWTRADRDGERYFPNEYLYQLLREGRLSGSFQIDPADSWLIAASERDLPIFVPGWEDSTLGNVFTAHVLNGDLSTFGLVRSGVEAMGKLANWYCETTMGKPVSELRPVEPEVEGEGGALRSISASRAVCPVGFFQIAGGIAGDFPICTVPMIHQDLRLPCPYWAYFCQISDSTSTRRCS